MRQNKLFVGLQTRSSIISSPCTVRKGFDN